MTKRTGGCLCGAVRYEIEGEPQMTAVCHCTHCQRQSGGVFSTNLVLQEGAYSQTGETRVFADKGDSGQGVFRHLVERPRTCPRPHVTLASFGKQGAKELFGVRARETGKAEFSRPDGRLDSGCSGWGCPRSQERWRPVDRRTGPHCRP